MTKLLDNIRIFPLGPVSFSAPKHSVLANLMRTNDFDCGVELALWHPSQHLYINDNLEKDFYRIFYTVFETTEPLGLDTLVQNEMIDEFWTVSEFNKQIIESKTDKIVRVVHEGIDPEIFNLQVKPFKYLQQIADGRSVVLSSGKYELRKGFDIVLKCYDILREKGYDFILVCAWDNPFDSNFNIDSVILPYTKYPDGIVAVKPFPDIASVASLYASCDIGFFPYRAEGWCLPLIEFMATTGNKVIATKYSGPLEYLTNEDCYYINDYRLEVAYDAVWFHGNQGLWAEPNFDECLANLELALKVSKADQEDKIARSRRITEQFSWDVATNYACSILIEHPHLT